MGQHDATMGAPPSRGDYTVSNWMVSFLDMLGYSAALDKMDVPLDETARAELTEAVKVVVSKRSLMLTTVDNILASAGTPPDSGIVEELARQEGIKKVEAKTWLRPELLREEGADHIVLMCPLASIAGTTSLFGAFQIFVASSAAMLVQLAAGAGRPQFALPLRGGIHVAPGMYIPDDKHLYSAARSGAHTLESKFADSPRTVLSDRVVEMLNSYARAGGRSIREQLNTETAQKLLRFITRYDGQHTLDFFGPEMSQFVRASNVDREIGVKAWRCANENLQHARSTRQDPRVEAKCAALVEYMSQRLPHWRGPSWRKP